MKLLKLTPKIIRDRLLEALRASNGRRKAAAAYLDITEGHLYRLMRTYLAPEDLSDIDQRYGPPPTRNHRIKSARS